MRVIEGPKQEGALPKIGVIIPTVNLDSDHLKDCLDSLVEHKSGQEMQVYIVLNSYAGFPKSCNHGMKRAWEDGCQAVVLLNDDTEIQDDNWLAHLWNGSKGKNLIGAKTCAIRPPFDMRYDAIAFWCVLIPKAAFDVLGYLDEGFGLGNCEDLFYCYKASKYGIGVLVSEDCLVHHKRSRTFRNDRLRDSFEGLKQNNLHILVERFRHYDSFV